MDRDKREVDIAQQENALKGGSIFCDGVAMDKTPRMDEENTPCNVAEEEKSPRLDEKGNSSLTNEEGTPVVAEEDKAPIAEGGGESTRLDEEGKAAVSGEADGEKVVDFANQVAKSRDLEHSKKKDKKKRVYSPELLIAGKGLLTKLKDALVAVLPISAIVLILCLTPIVDVSVREAVIFFASALISIVGIGLFNLGADLAMTPMGEQMGAGLTKSRSLPLLLGVSFIMGILVTVAEPDLSVLAQQVSAVINKTVLIVTIGVGVGLFLLLSIVKVVFKKNIASLLLFFYLAVFALVAILAEKGKSGMLPLIFDSGGVTTGPITVPFIMALGVGVATTIGGKNARENSFGLIALCSIGPILAMLILSLATKGNISYNIPDYSVVANAGELGKEIGGVALDVIVALGLIAACFAILQFTLLKLPMRKIARMSFGILYTFVGLVIFFTAVEVGFMPIGFKLGQSLANFSKPLLIVFSFVMGFVVVLAEPAVHVLNKQVELITGGAVSKRAMLIALSIGVGISIGLSAIRILYGFSIMYYLIPGYIISLGLSLFVPKLYTSIAFDSGGVASGPLTASFILPFAIGACTVLQGESKAMELAFGVVAMVAMTPLITIQLLGFRAIFAARVKEKMTMHRIVSYDDEQIIEFM